MHDQVQECLHAKDKSFRPCSQEDLDRMAAEESAPYLVKACSVESVQSRIRANGTKKFIRMILLVLLASPKLPILLERMQELPEPPAQAIGTLLQEVYGWNLPDSDDVAGGPASTYPEHNEMAGDTRSPGFDPRAEVFQLEEQYAKIMAQLERRNRDYDSLESEHQALGGSFARLQETNV